MLAQAKNLGATGPALLYRDYINDSRLYIIPSATDCPALARLEPELQKASDLR